MAAAIGLGAEPMVGVVAIGARHHGATSGVGPWGRGRCKGEDARSDFPISGRKDGGGVTFPEAR